MLLLGVQVIIYNRQERDFFLKTSLIYCTIKVLETHPQRHTVAHIYHQIQFQHQCPVVLNLRFTVQIGVKSQCGTEVGDLSFNRTTSYARNRFVT